MSVQDIAVAGPAGAEQKGIGVFMRIALASAPVINRDVESNLQAICGAIKKCRGKADLILFGESALQGFDSLCWDYEKDLQTAVSLTDKPILRARAAAKENEIALSFGFMERESGALHSSQIFIGADGEIVNVFRRVSTGWKERWVTDGRYREGTRFEAFSYMGRRIAVGLCGDLWTDGRPEEMKALHADIVLWPVWCDYAAADWNEKIKYEYAEQAALCGKDVFLVNPFCADPASEGCAAGGSAHFQNGVVVCERSAGEPGVLLAEI